MNVLILGSTGHIGRRFVELMRGDTALSLTGSSRRKTSATGDGVQWLPLDTLDRTALSAALSDKDVVINCVAGKAKNISTGARTLVDAAKYAGFPRIVHLSTMAVYGSVEGLIDEMAPLSPDLGWYGQSKCEAETAMQAYANQGGEAIILRPGCVFGPGSELWVGRIGRLLNSRRLGDLGIHGDGWSNLVHVDDVCNAIAAVLKFQIIRGEVPAFNLAAPDSPRWNNYFIDFALATGSTPVQRIAHRRLLLDSLLAGPPLKILEKASAAINKKSQVTFPDAIPPGLARLWNQHIRLDPNRATSALQLAWTPYREALNSSVNWFSNTGRGTAPRLAGTVWSP
jgi:nucleoside-diphosphate-sugar epimerase